MPYGIPEPVVKRSSIIPGRFDYENQVAIRKYHADVERARRVQKVINQFEAAQEKANLENIKRYEQGLDIFEQLRQHYMPDTPRSPSYTEGMGLLQENIEDFQPGGAYGQGAMGEFDVGARQSRSRAFQGLVSSGMSNVHGAFDIQALKQRGQFGKTVEDERMRMLTGARGAKAGALMTSDEARRQAIERIRTSEIGFIERREDTPPDPNLLAQMVSQASSA